MLGRILIPVSLSAALLAFGPSASAPPTSLSLSAPAPIVIGPAPEGPITGETPPPAPRLDTVDPLEDELEQELLASRLAALDGANPEATRGLWANLPTP